MRFWLALVMVFCVAGTVGVVGSSAGAATGSPITLGLICSCSGEAGPEYQGVQGALMARLDEQNALGGVDGHKLEVVFEDDATNPAQDPVAVQTVLSKHVDCLSQLLRLLVDIGQYAKLHRILSVYFFCLGPSLRASSCRSEKTGFP